MNTMRIVYMGTPGFAVPSLEAIAALPEEFEIALVVTGADKPRRKKGAPPEPTPVKQAALALGLPVYETDDVKDPAFAERIRHLRPDVIVVAAFRILPPAVYEAALLGAFNLHASLLPAYRGAAPINWAIIEGEAESGVTTFFLQRQVDTGNVILTQKSPIGPDESAEEYADRLSQIGAGAVVESLRRIAGGPIEVTEQNDALATRAPKLTRENTRIDWSRPVRRIHDFVRGLSRRPTAWTTLDGKTMKLFRTAVAEERHHLGEPVPGTLFIDGDRLFAACSDGWLELLELQLEGKKPMEAAGFLRGFRAENEELRFV